MHPKIRKACKQFLASFPEFTLLEWSGDEVVAYRNHDPDPYVATEYMRGSQTREAFERLEELICEEPPFRYKP